MNHCYAITLIYGGYIPTFHSGAFIWPYYEAVSTQQMEATGKKSYLVSNKCSGGAVKLLVDLLQLRNCQGSAADDREFQSYNE